MQDFLDEYQALKAELYCDDLTTQELIQLLWALQIFKIAKALEQP